MSTESCSTEFSAFVSFKHLQGRTFQAQIIHKLFLQLDFWPYRIFLICLKNQDQGLIGEPDFGQLVYSSMGSLYQTHIINSILVQY